MLPALGAVRRVQALMTLGWTHEAMTAYCGVNTRLLLDHTDPIPDPVHDRVAAMYRHLLTRRGPSDQVAADATAAGWAGPLAWDDIDRDHGPEPEPDETDDELVDEIAVWRRAAGDKSVPLSPPERFAVVEMLDGLGPAEVERRTGINVRRERLDHARAG